MSEIDSLNSQIAHCESRISALRKEQFEGYDFVSMIKSGAEDSQNAIFEKEKKKAEFYTVDGESTFAYSLGNNIKENYGVPRQNNIQYGFEEIVVLAKKRLRNIEHEIDQLNMEIASCRNRISQIMEEMERLRRLQETQI